LLALQSFVCISASERNNLKWGDKVFDFGQVGSDYKLTHTFFATNEGFKRVRIIKAVADCSCSRIYLSDSLVNPEDTVFFKVTFDTRDLQGPESKFITITLAGGDEPEIKLYTKATIGQWYFGLRPEPLSLFFLPRQKPKKVTIPNRTDDDIIAQISDIADTTFTANPLTMRAKPGQNIEIEVVPNANLTPSTYRSNFTVSIDTDKTDKPVFLTIPVKISKY